MKVLVTGGQGFVGRHLIEHLTACGDEVVVSQADVTDRAAIRELITGVAPEAVYHLAGLAHVGESWDAPGETFRVNGLGTVEVLSAAAACARPPRTLVVSSAEVYGNVGPDDVPLGEDAPLRPVSPYAASKVAAEFAAMQAYLGSKLPTLRARAFNHAGPGQAPVFLIPALARRIAAAERDGTSVLPVGNLSPRRDITDVRDVVRAYRLLVEHGEAGEVYNVCCGRDVKVESVADRLLQLSGVGARFEPNPTLMRPVDVPVLLGDNTRLVAATGWAPTYDLDDTLSDVLAEARAETPPA